MLLVIGAVLVVGGLVAAALFVLAVPAMLGLIAYDVRSWRKPEPAVDGVGEEAPAWARSPEEARGRISLQRGVARAFVIVGGVFWGVATFAGVYSFWQTGVGWAMLGAFVPFVATLATLIVGWYYERVTAVMLLVASAGVVYLGITQSFEPGIWAIAVVGLIGPMLTASVLFWLARREQAALDLQLASLPELAPAMATTEPRA